MSLGPRPRPKWSWMCPEGPGRGGARPAPWAAVLGPSVPGAGGLAGSWGLQGLGPWACGQSTASAPGAQGEGCPPEADPHPSSPSPPTGRMGGGPRCPAPSGAALGPSCPPLRWAQQVPSGQQGCPWAAAAVLASPVFPRCSAKGRGPHAGSARPRADCEAWVGRAAPSRLGSVLPQDWWGAPTAGHARSLGCALPERRVRQGRTKLGAEQACGGCGGPGPGGRPLHLHHGPAGLCTPRMQAEALPGAAACRNRPLTWPQCRNSACGFPNILPPSQDRMSGAGFQARPGPFSWGAWLPLLAPRRPRETAAPPPPPGAGRRP